MSASAKDAIGEGYQPGRWLRELVRIKPAPWPWGHSVRSALCIALPWAAGFAADATVTALWVSLGAMMASAAEPDGAYRARLRQVAVATAMGAPGFLAGYLVALPWAGVVAAMAGIGFLAGVVSGWGAKFSLGAMQFLLLASIAIGVPGLPPPWQPALLFAAGALLYLAMLGATAAIFPRRPERDLIVRLAQALAALATSRAANPDAAAPDSAARRAVTDALGALGADALATRTHIVGRSPEAEALAATIAGGDEVFARLIAEGGASRLTGAAATLGAVAESLARGGGPAKSDGGEPGTLGHAVAAFAVAAGAAGSGNVFAAYTAATVPVGTVPGTTLRLLVGRLTPGSTVLRGAFALALCIALAYAVRWFETDEHWFWVPLTVGLIMKPDLGSVFARAVLRAGGTIVGAAIGAALLAVVPKGPELVLAIVFLAALMPWAMRPSYAVQALVLTPLVLVLVSAIEPGPHNTDFATERILDTIIGSVIVLVFGYFIWPRGHRQELAATFRGAKTAVAAYLVAIVAPAPTAAGDATVVARLRRTAYEQLSNFRSHLQTLMVEPPPAGREAAAWFPLLAITERICDRVTAFSVAVGSDPVPPADAAMVKTVAERMAMPPHVRAAMAPLHYEGTNQPIDALVNGIGAELRHMGRLQVAGTFPDLPSPGSR